MFVDEWDMAEADREAKKEAAVTATCPRCCGSGEDPFPMDERECKLCHGEGVVSQDTAAEYGFEESIPRQLGE